MKVWGWLVLAITCEVIGTSSLKATEGFTRLWPSVLTIASYGGAFYFLSLTLKEIPIGVAYAVWSGFGTVLITLVGWLFFKQHINLPAAVGIGLIVVGVVILNVWGTPHAAAEEADESALVQP